MNLLLRNITLAREGVTVDVRISGDTIVEQGVSLLPKRKEHVIDFTGHFLFDGLTNSHDHLEMNLYPKLGTPPYNNYTEWSKDIYKPLESPLKEIEKTDVDYRLLWGGVKNLISGVTTVIHHNPWRRVLDRRSFPVNVPKINWAHSLAFERKLPVKPDEKKPFVIHAAEGIDDFARNEVYRLDELGLLKKNTVIVHGISADLDLVRARGASVVWCPASNLYMFNRTLPTISGLKAGLGTDSTLTGSPTLLDEMRIALETKIASKEEIVEMVCRPSAKADLFVSNQRDLLNVQPRDIILVMVRGEIMLQDLSTGLPDLKRQLTVQGVRKQSTVNVGKLLKYFERKIGRGILERNPVFRLLTA
jgi:cytosine/adenosine deaminase-related metal-dependent hydrolase